MQHQSFFAITLDTFTSTHLQSQIHKRAHRHSRLLRHRQKNFLFCCQLLNQLQRSSRVVCSKFNERRKFLNGKNKKNQGEKRVYMEINENFTTLIIVLHKLILCGLNEFLKVTEKIATIRWEWPEKLERKIFKDNFLWNFLFIFDTKMFIENLVIFVGTQCLDNLTSFLKYAFFSKDFFIANN